jgi:cilia- and flagella-associated protein 65
MYETIEPQVMTARYERAHVWGIDCVERLTWRGWEPGGSYVRTVTLKNVGKKALKVKYRLPQTKYFEMEFPETMKIQPGLSATVDVTFRPIRFEQYDDFIEFKVAGAGAFQVKVSALLPFISLKMPPAVDFGYGAVNELMQKDFTFVNDGDVAVSYKWAVDLPFVFTPGEGTLEPGETGHVHAEFTPADATVNVVNAICALTDQSGHALPTESYNCSVTAVGKYPYVRFSEPEIDFGEVMVGRTVEQTVKLMNQSPVGASYEVARGETEHDHVFKCTGKGSQGGYLKQKSHEEFKVQFTPSMPGTFSSESFKAYTPGGNVATVKITGTAIGPSVTLSQSTFQFGSVVAGKSVRRVLDIENHSDLPVHWQIDSECLGTFALGADRGVLEPKFQGIPGKAQVVVTFAPIEPANYHKRIIVALRDHRPLAFDVVGTGYDDKRRPAPMRQSHVEEYRAMCAAGLITPGQPPSRRERSLFPNEIDAVKASAMTAQETYMAMFEPDPLVAVSLDKSQIDFGPTNRFKTPQSRTVTVTNDCKQKLVVFWGGQEPAAVNDTSVDAEAKRAAAADRNPFFAFPESCDLRPGQSAEFRITFRPTKDKQHYARQLECFAYVKSMRSFRQVTEDNFTPPWTSTVWAFGHTHGHAGAQLGFQPKCSFTARGSRLYFPPTVKGDYAFQTIALRNDGDTAVGFEFPAKALGSGLEVDENTGYASPFSCHPSKGAVPPRSFTLVTFRFDATDTEPHREQMHCVLNGLPERAITLDVRARGHVPRVTVGDGNAFVFTPTCVGAAATREIEMRNASRINVLYEWAIPERLANVLGVSPHAGMIRGDQTIKSTWTFCPNKSRKFGFKIPLLLRVPNGEVSDPGATGRREAFVGAGTVEERVDVNIHAEGTSGSVAMRPESVDFGHAVVDQSAERTIELHNRSNGIVRYRLETVFDDGCTEFDADVTFDESVGQIPARSSSTVRVTYRGRCRGDVGFRIVCRVVNAAKPSRTVQEEEDDAPSVHAIATADYPTLCVTDAACPGVAKPVLWKRLSLNALNAELARPPTAVEDRLQRTGGYDGSLASARSLQGLTSVALGLGVGLEGAEPTAAYVEVCNTGALPAEWRLMTRDESEVDMENWVEIGEPDDEITAHQRFVVEHGIVEVSPKRGVLQPGERQPVRVLYKHARVGQHWLTALLNVKDGRSVRLELGGRTVGSKVRCLDISPANPSMALHTFAPVRIGDVHPPKQSVELRNPTGEEVEWNVDLNPLAALRTANWGFDILTCHNPRGTIPPFGTALLNWTFQPCEERAYECAVAVEIVKRFKWETAETCVMTLRGAGTLPEDRGGAPVDDTLVGDCARESWIGYRTVPSLPPASEVALSSGSCVFGAVPTLSIVRRVVTLRSMTDDREYEFEWQLGAFAEDAGGLEPGSSVAIEPMRGVVERGEEVFVKITYSAGPNPQVFDGEIRCVLTPPARTKEEIEEEERYLAEKANEPEYIAIDGPPEPTMPTKKELAGESEVWGAIAAQDQTLRRSVMHNHTTSSAAKFPHLEKIHDAAHEKTLPKPRPPPEPITLHLTLEGRSVPQVAFREEHGADAFDRFFVPDWRPDINMDSIPAHLDEEDMEHIFQDMLHELLSDPAVRRGMEDLADEVVPMYLAQRGGGAPRDFLPDVPEEHDGDFVGYDDGVVVVEAGGEGSVREGSTKAASSKAASTRAASKAPSVAGDVEAVALDEAPSETEDEPEPDEYAFLEPLEVAKAQANPEFRSLAEWAMEATLYNLVRELHATEVESAELAESARWQSVDPDGAVTGIGGVGTGAGWTSEGDE